MHRLLRKVPEEHHRSEGDQQQQEEHRGQEDPTLWQADGESGAGSGQDRLQGGFDRREVPEGGGGGHREAAVINPTFISLPSNKAIHTIKISSFVYRKP